ncbi:MAG: hypothetical protein P1P86_03220 [Bacteroidales bacterium]|nr:hypothetical protein [Bacteroidales bacterium]
MTGGAYHLISIGTGILFLYMMSLWMVHLRVIPGKQNRRFWNFLLLFFFISTAVPGLFLVVKVNYKLNIPWVEEVMQWHVDCGIAFSLVALFHLLRNIKYYTGKQAQSSAKTNESGDIHPAGNFFTGLQESIFFLLLGYISIMAQLVLLREFIKSFLGNELVIGIFLAIWMVLTALGAKSGNNYRGRIALPGLYRILALLGALPLLIYLLLILVNRFFFLPGYQAGILDITLVILLLTALFTGISGFLFGYVSRSPGAHRSRSASYRLDALGSLAGGIFFSLILVYLLNNLQALTLLFLITSVLLVWIYGFPKPGAPRWTLLFAGILLFALSLAPELLNAVEGLRYRQEKVLHIKDTPHGNLTFTSRNDQVTGYLDGNPVLSSGDLSRIEESVHFPALQHPDPLSFLLLGGGLTGHLDEVAKYLPDSIDYCEADPWIFRLGRIYFPENSSAQLRFIPRDGRSWLKQSGSSQYDVIISTAGDPLTLGWNRYFTLEFYQLIKKHLAPEGIFSMQLSTGGNYVNNEGSQLLGINYHTLKQVFTHVAMVPGNSTYFLASEAPLSMDFPTLLQDHEISTTYVHPDYLDANRILFDSGQLLQRIQNEKALINRDLRPGLFFASLTGLESRMGKHSLAITGILASLLWVVLWLSYKPVRSLMYISGFTGAGIQMVLILVMQSLYGFAYLAAPMMITVFMGGLVLGTLRWKRKRKEASLLELSGMAGLLALVSALGFLLLRAGALSDTGFSGQLLLGAVNLITGTLVGTVFSMAVHLKDGSTPVSPGILYSADLAGAALGTLLPVVFLLPLIGVRNTFILFTGINLITMIRLWVKGNTA